MRPYQSSSYVSAGSMHLPAAALHRLTHAASVEKRKGRGRNISASRASHFPPQLFNCLILFHSFVFMLLDPNIFPSPSAICAIQYLYLLCVYIYNKLIRFHFPLETHQQVKIQFKNNNWGKEKAKTPM